MKADFHGNWIIEDKRIVGLMIDDHYWDILAVYENTVLHHYYHAALKELDDERHTDESGKQAD